MTIMHHIPAFCRRRLRRITEAFFGNWPVACRLDFLTVVNEVIEVGAAMHSSSVATHSQKTGRPIHTPASPVRIVLAVIVALGGGVFLTRWLDNSGRQQYSGYTQAEKSIITADANARIQRWFVKPGDHLSPNQPLVVLNDESIAEQRAAKLREIESFAAEVAQAQARAEVELAWRQKELDTEIFQTKLRSAGFLKEQLTHQMENLAWQEFVDQWDGRPGSITPEDIFQSVTYERLQPADESRVRAMLRQDAARNALEVNAAQLDICDARLNELKEVRNELSERIRVSLGIDVAEANLQRARRELQEIEAKQTPTTLSATAYGTVGTIYKQAGETVAAGDAIIELFDNDRRFITVDIPTESLKQIAVGDEVQLAFAGESKRVGQIALIPPQAQRCRTPVETGETNSDDAVVTVRIEPAGKLWPDIPVGARVEVILGD